MDHFRFVDLFAGIGGFHQAMEQLGGTCVFASEIDPFCIETYRANYHMDAGRDIRDVAAEEIPPHDVLCAGFPCQAFSKAGRQQGMSDTRGTLFFEIERILRRHRTPYIILENVRNLVAHDHGNTWRTIQRSLHNIGYRLTPAPLILSPHQLGVPQLRERVVILGVYDPARVEEDLDIRFEGLLGKDENSIEGVLSPDGEAEAAYRITAQEEMVLTAWDQFYRGIREKVIGFPIWSPYFRAEAPDPDFPGWKQEFVRKNMALYANNQPFIDAWLREYHDLRDFTPTQRKMEWQAGTAIESVWQGVIQFRPSGVRIKRPTTFPALVAIVQIPVVGARRRRLTVREAARLQSFPEEFIPNPNDAQAYKQLGNAVNVEVIKLAARKLFAAAER